MSTTETRIIEAQKLLQDADRTIGLIRGCLLICRQEGGFEASMLQIERLRAIEDAVEKCGLDPVAIAFSSLASDSERVANLGSELSDDDACLLLDRVAQAEAEILKARLLEPNDDIDVSEFLDRSFDEFRTRDHAAPEDEPPLFGSETENADEFEPDEEMIAVFKIEADELLSNIESNVEALMQTPGDGRALWEMRRSAHTLKGAAGIIGLADLSRIAHKVEDLLDLLSGSEIEPKAADVDLLNRAAGLMRDLSGGPADEAAGERIRTICGQFDLLTAENRRDGGSADPAPNAELPGPTIENGPAEAEPAVPGPPKNSPRPIVRVALTRLNELSDSVRELLISRTVLARRMEELSDAVLELSRTARTVRASAQHVENDLDAALLDGVGRADHLQTDLADGGPRFDRLEMERYTSFHASARELAEAAQECHTLAGTFDSLASAAHEAFDLHRRLVDDVQQRAMQIRLIRFGSIATRLERAVRVTCQEQEKSAEIVVGDQDVEIDTDVLDSLVEPLMHLVKNAVAHGIESADARRLAGKPKHGIITVSARNEGTHFIVSVSDDGRGISGRALSERAADIGLLPAKSDQRDEQNSQIDLIFTPGLSTADKLTLSSGRGVGLSIVKESVEDQGGSVTVETELHAGTTFALKIPLEFAVARSVLVRSAGNTAAIPARSVHGMFEVGRKELVAANGGVKASVGGIEYPFLDLSDYFTGGEKPLPADVMKVLLVGEGAAQFALAIDDFLSTEEIIIKALSQPLNDVPGLLGAALLGSGEAVPVLDVAALCTSGPLGSETAAEAEVPRTLRVLVVDDSPSVRHMTANALKAAGLEPMTAKDGLDALDVLRRGPLPDAILSDVEMPEMDGFAFAEAVRSEPDYCAIPFLFITSRVSEKHRQRAAELGITGHLPKPFTASDIVNVVRKVCG
ncbi:MAG: response regulator [Chloracidobacterium sp.]|nr:response regulator [Chloracidobacterium sp.]